jgi:hypothetical protein
MSPRRNSELDSLIADITVDCYNDNEQLTAFEAAFEAAFENDATLPCPGLVIGEEVSVTSIDMANGRRENSWPRANTRAVATKGPSSISNSTGTRQPRHSSPHTGAGIAADRPFRTPIVDSAGAGLAG